MAEIVNLRAKRKEAARKEARQKADENAAKHGLTKAERDRLTALLGADTQKAN